MWKAKLVGVSACLMGLLLLLMVGCASHPEPQALRIGVMYSTDIVPLVLLKQQGLDRKADFQLDMQVFSSAKDRDAALQAGELDGVFTDLIGICLYQNAGLDVKITGVTDGDYELLAGADCGVTSLADVDGHSIAISENTLIEYTVDVLLERAGQSGKIKKQLVPRIPERLELLRAGQVDLGLMPDPFATLARQDGAVRLGSANEAGLYPAVSAFTQKAIDQRREEIQRFYAAYEDAVAQVNQGKAGDAVLHEAGYPSGLEEVVVLPEFRGWQLPSEQELSEAIRWAAAKGLCAETLDPALLLCDLRESAC